MKRLTFHIPAFAKHLALPFGLVAVCLSALCTSCLDDESLSLPNTPMGNFKSCWRTLDEHYCYFAEKKVDWDDVYRRYEPYFRDSVQNDFDAFHYLYQMLGELRDGHVNLYSNFNVARNWSWFEDYPQNFDATLLERYYLGTNYWMAGGMKYGMLRDTIGYVHYPSFSSTVGKSNINYVLGLLGNAKGLIFDVRDNGGGNLTNVETIVSRFTAQDLTYGYIMHKQGPGHDDFSEPQKLTVDGYSPDRSKKPLWDAARQPVVILTNRSCFSATNTFVMAMKALDGQPAEGEGATGTKMVKTMGDRTGGGGGLPFESTLPNGWVVRFSTSPMLDIHQRPMEEGFAPDYFVQMDSLHAYQDHIDDIIESARVFINQNTRMEYTDKKK